MGVITDNTYLTFNLIQIKGMFLMDRKLIVGIVIAILVIVSLGAYVSIQGPGMQPLNGSNGTADNSSINSGANQNSNNQTGNNANSSKQTVSAKRVVCPACHGTGWDYCMGCHGTGLETCDTCGGDGKIEKYMINYVTKKKYLTWTTCTKCGGDGKVTCTICGGNGGKTKCAACGGDGYIDQGDKGYSGNQ